MITNIPYSETLPVNLLSAAFGKTTATYKFYWFLSILQIVEEGKVIIPKKEIFSRMISNAWYTVNYFKISFGKHDKVQEAVEILKKTENIPVDERRELVFSKVHTSSNQESLNAISHFDNQVPHWFLSPWFPKHLKPEIYKGSQQLLNNCPYRLFQDRIEVNPMWVAYFTNNSKILKDFCYWNLCLFLQSRNPNVPDIPNKLIKPVLRNTLKKQKDNYWNLVFDKMGTIDCIYSGEILTKENYVLDHFVPYNFVSHDLMWNLIPAHPCTNSSKSDRLPRLDSFFPDFFNNQRRAFEIVTNENPNTKFREDFLTIFPNLNDFLKTDSEKSKLKYREIIEPLVTIASNNGFIFYEQSTK